MRKTIIVLLAVCLLAFAGQAFATNGDNLIGIGTISRSMGGVGIAAPQDAISATFANPAAMCFGPYCPGAQVDFDATFFMPKVDTKVTYGPAVSKEDSDDKIYAIPAIGISSPINNKLRFGLSAYGVSGLGVDYRDTGLNIGGTLAETSTQLQIMKFSPNIAYLMTDNLSLGLGLQIDYSALDLGVGGSFGYGFGAKLGALWKATDMFSFGLTFTTPQGVKHKNVIDSDGNGFGDADLELEAPMEVGLGVAITPMQSLLIGIDGKWINWSGATGYDDFDWDDQYVVAVGLQFNPNAKLALRLGYNYGNNPVKEHNAFNAAGFTNVQGSTFPNANYEFLRIVGFPAIAEQHITLGIGYEITEKFSMNAGFMYVPEETIKETDSSGGLTYESSLSETSVDLGLTWRF